MTDDRQWNENIEVDDQNVFLLTSEAQEQLPTLYRHLAHARQQAFVDDDDLRWTFPEDYLPGVTKAFGVAVVRGSTDVATLGIPGQVAISLWTPPTSAK